MQILARTNVLQAASSFELLTRLADLRPDICGNACDPHGNPLPLEFGLFVDPDDFGNWATVDPAAEPGLEPIDLAYLQHTLQEAIAREGLRYRIENDGAGYAHAKLCAADTVAGATLASSKWAAIAILEAFVEYLNREGSADAAG
ncbi:MAG TPA: hypothetical protein V6C88_04400 [Chroococcidiopsis sp.]